MSEGITEDGLKLYDYNTLLENIQDDFTSIYSKDGESINFGSETPDGQLTNIFAQIATDTRELYREVYNSFDSSKCSGVVQDSRYALNYIFRHGGSFTIQNIDIVVNQTVELQGLDEKYNDLEAASYTVSDNAGNLWYLIDSVELTKGTYSLPFRSKTQGLIQPVIGTITNQVTKILGVVSVNNSVAPTTLGSTEENDTIFELRRSRSTAKKGQNNLDALLGQLLDLEGVTDARVHNNPTAATDETQTPSYTVWVIVEGGANSEIADLIYENSCGLPTRGEISIEVPTSSGKTFPVKFDRANPIPLYIRFVFKLTTDLSAVDFDSIKASIVENLTYSLDETAETSKITEIAANAILSNGGGGYALNVEISTDNTNWSDYIPSSSLQNKFVVDITRIQITAQE